MKLCPEGGKGINLRKRLMERGSRADCLRRRNKHAQTPKAERGLVLLRTEGRPREGCRKQGEVRPHNDREGDGSLLRWGLLGDDKGLEFAPSVTESY